MTRFHILTAAVVGLLAAPLAAQAAAPTAAPAASDSQFAKPASATSPANAAALPDETSASVGQPVRTELITNGPIPDTPANRARFGGPNSHGGRLTKASGD
jgi:hypothetical protein